MVLSYGIEPYSQAYKTRASPAMLQERYSMVVMVGIDPTSSPYEGGAHPSTPHHRVPLLEALPPV